DNEKAIKSLSRVISSFNLHITIFAETNEKKGVSLVSEKKPEVVILDLCLNEEEGVDSGFRALAEISRLSPTTRVIVLTGHTDVEYGVRAIQQGASSFLHKPPNPFHLKVLIENAVWQSHLMRKYEELKKQNKVSSLDNLIVGHSLKIQRVKEEISYAASHSQPVLLLGETGTGKGLCAYAIHLLSSRNKQNFVRYQPSFSNSDMVNSDLFGHIKGAFTGAASDRDGLLLKAHKGTLFLDDIDALPVETQVLLLGVLQDGEFRPVGSDKVKKVDIRVICATNADVEELISNSKLRRDFYFRTSHIRISIPPLRERLEDIEELAEHFLNLLKVQKQLHLSISKEALEKLKNYSWPGNVREFSAVIESSAFRANFERTNEILPKHITFLSEKEDNNTTLSYKDMLREFKIKVVNEALARSGGNQVLAAKELGIDRTTLRRILQAGRVNG
ncbi:MAG: sigma-54-dependent Fis family transcriptional regulator, partial [Candidatus Dadabacteria bacterium]